MWCSRSVPDSATRRPFSANSSAGMERRDHRGTPVEAESRLRRLGYDNIGVHIGDGSLGWAEHAPYDKIIVTAATELVPPALLQQLRPGGRMVLPTGLTEDQKLTVVEKNAAGP